MSNHHDNNYGNDINNTNHEHNIDKGYNKVESPTPPHVLQIATSQQPPQICHCIFLTVNIDFYPHETPPMAHEVEHVRACND